LELVQRWGGGIHMNKGRVGEDRGSKETDGCPLTAPTQRHAVSDIYTTDHNRLPSVDCDAFGLTANVSGIKVWVIPLQRQHTPPLLFHLCLVTALGSGSLLTSAFKES
jgi:hypothetical protein